jgi:hypothetical protein
MSYLSRLKSFINFTSILSLILISVFSLAFPFSSQAYFGGGSGGGVDGVSNFEVSFDTVTNDLTVTLDQDVDANIEVYYSTFNETGSASTVINEGDVGIGTLYLGTCVDVDCTPADARRAVIKVQEDGSSTVLVKRIEIDADGNVSIYSSYDDTTTDLSAAELAWLSEIIVETTDPDPDDTDDTPEATESASTTDDTDDSGSSDSTGDSSGDTGSGDSSGDSGSSGSSDSGNTSPASPEFCGDATPTNLTGLSISSQGGNSAILRWNASSPVSHYALIFTRTSDGEQYGSTNIGNTTSYTIQGISGQDSYTFEVFGVNGCQPGERGSVSSSVFSGSILTARPTGDTGQVLSAATEADNDNQFSDEVEDENISIPAVIDDNSDHPPDSDSTGQVLGDTDEICSNSKSFIPYLLLIAELILLITIEYYFRSDKKYTRWYLATGLAAASIIVFYLIGGCDCQATGFLSILCKWFWIFAIVTAAISRGLGHLVVFKKTKTKK